MTRKNFKSENNPAMSFISTETKARVDSTEEKGAPIKEEAPSRSGTMEEAPEGFKKNPAYVETRNKHLQSLITQSLFNSLKERAESEHISVNELVNRLLTEGIER